MLNATRCLLTSICAFCFLVGTAAGVAVPIPLGQQDDFQDGTLQDWLARAILVNVPNGGPRGEGDRYLQITADHGPDGVKHVGAKNQEQWGGRPWRDETTGDYVTHGVTGIAVDAKNFGPDELHLRLMLTGHGRWTSTESFILPPGGDWQHLVFGLTEDHLTQVEGSEPLVNCLRDMSRYAIRHFPGPPARHGNSPEVNATLGLDNITAVVVPEPGTMWLLAAAALAGWWGWARRAAVRQRPPGGKA